MGAALIAISAYDASSVVRNGSLKPRGPLLTGKASMILPLGLDDRPIGSLHDSDLATSLPPDFSPDRFFRSVFAKPNKT
jgi:hypothetical protein